MSAENMFECSDSKVVLERRKLRIITLIENMIISTQSYSYLGSHLKLGLFKTIHSTEEDEYNSYD